MKIIVIMILAFYCYNLNPEGQLWVTKETR